MRTVELAGKRIGPVSKKVAAFVCTADLSNVLEAWVATVASTAEQLVAVTAEQVIVVTESGLSGYALDDVQLTPAGLRMMDGGQLSIALVPGDRAQFRTLLRSLGVGEWQEGLGQSNVTPVPPSRITTLQCLPGWDIAEVVGVVATVDSNSGWTAAEKGRVALERSLEALALDASRRGGNAVVGLTVGPFGAAGGVTSVLGGDAVGVILMGTAVVVKPASPQADTE